jgi:hypothetical protein
LTGTIEKATLERVSLEWMERLDKCISTNGEHAGGVKNRFRGGSVLAGGNRDGNSSVGHPIAMASGAAIQCHSKEAKGFQG